MSLTSGRTSRTLVKGLKLVLMLQAASVMIIVVRSKKDQDATKREQTLQIDVAFIIHGSKNITSPERKKTFKEALDWARKITNSFGEIGINKTRAGLILYAEKAKLMFNFTQKLDKGAVMGGIDEATSPPVLGNKTFTGKALKLALKTLVKQTRKDAMKKLFVFSDRPSDDDPETPADAIREQDVEVYGFGESGTAIKDVYIHDHSLDSLYMMLKDGPYKGSLTTPRNPVPNSQDLVTKQGNLVSQQKNLSSNSENSMSNTGNPLSNAGTLVSLPRNEAKPGTEIHQPPIQFNPIISKSEHEISGIISKEMEPKEEDFTKINYGQDASVVITENRMKNTNSVGRYSSTIDENHSGTQFGTVIGGVRVNGQSKFDVIKPKSDSEESNLRSKLGSIVGNHRKRRYKFLKLKQKGRNEVDYKIS